MNTPVGSLLLVLVIFANAVLGRTPSNRCYEIIKNFEGLQLEAYR